MNYLAWFAFFLANYWWAFAILAGVSGMLRLLLGNINII